MYAAALCINVTLVFYYTFGVFDTIYTVIGGSILLPWDVNALEISPICHLFKEKMFA